MSELEVEGDEESGKASLSFIPTPRTNPFALSWDCVEVNLIQALSSKHL